MENLLQGFIAPSSIAIVGASTDITKPSGKIVDNILKKGFAGELFLINPKADSILGRPAIPAIGALPQAPDLAYIAIPARFVAGALEELAALGTRRVIILSAGFGELNPEGAAEEKRLAKIADENGMVILGPNCLGVTSPVHAGKFAGLLPEMRPGGINFISGSGATVDLLAEQAVRRGLIFETFFTVGNSAQMGVTDVLGLFDQRRDDAPPAPMMLYLEKVGSPAKLLAHAQSLVSKGSPVIAIKSGVTEGGRRAAASHTGALAAGDAAVEALFRKAGVIRVTSKLDMVDAAAALVLAKGSFDGRRACVITDAGGLGVMATDELNRQGIETPMFQAETRAQLAELLPPGAGINNPVDMLPTRTPEQVSRTLSIICEKERDNLDYILVQFGDPGLADNWPLYQAVARAMDELPLPVIPCFPSSISSAQPLAKYRALGKCHFEDEVSMARAVGRMVNRPRVFAPAPDPPGYDREAVMAALAGLSGPVPPEAARLALAAAGIPLPAERLLRSTRDLAGLAESLSAPWAMKVSGPLHKTELGGVAVGVAAGNADQVFERLMAIPGANGVLVQEMISGPEALMGLSREGDFGHLVAFGLGGIMAEALKDLCFGLAPLTVKEAARQIDSIRGLAALKDHRGLPGMDLAALADILARVSLLGRDVPTIKELDLNPVKGTGRRLAAVDLRIILD